MSKKWFDIKDEKELEELKYVHPYLFLILADIVRFCFDSKFPAPIVTSLCRTAEEEAEAGAESRSHMTRRAFDLRSTVYTKDQRDAIMNYVTATYGTKYGAVNSQGQIRIMVHHKVDGSQFHFHTQIHRRFELPEWKGLDAE